MSCLGIAFLKSRSPSFFVDQIKKPLLIIHGINDPRVPLNGTDELVAALKTNNIPVSYVQFPDEGI